MVLERDTIGKEYMMYVCVYLKCIGWDFTYLLDLDVHLLLIPNLLLHIHVYYCKGIQTAGQILYYSVILNIHHMEERFK